MLNVLLSFAQFEREVTGERIRDKIAASKRKGMWMGGNPPLGYDVKDKQLVINQAEAETVRKLFSAYLEVGTVRRLKLWAESEGILTKRRRKGGVSTGGKLFSRGNLYALLSNCIYKGEISHGKQRYRGQHKAIVEPSLWDKVSAALREKSSRRKSDFNGHSESLLTGRLFDETGDRLSPSHAVKGRKRYRYYISRRLMTGEGDATCGWRLPAKAIETTIAQAIGDFLNNQSRLTRVLAEITTVHALKNALERAAELVGKKFVNGESVLLSLVHRAVVYIDRIEIKLSKTALLNQLGFEVKVNEDPEMVSLELPMNIQRRGVEAKLIIPSLVNNPPSFDAPLVRTIALAYAWFEQVTGGRVVSLQDLATREGLPASEVSRLLPLALLPPDVVAAIMTGRQPPQLTAERLKRLSGLPLAWRDQRAALGFHQEL
jgi:hypothetical protein